MTCAVLLEEAENCPDHSLFAGVSVDDRR
jgi:hypothetical protein